MSVAPNGDWATPKGAPAFELEYPIATRLRLDSEDGPWGLVEVCGAISKPGGVGHRVIVRPVQMAGDEDCSPLELEESQLAEVGYVVESAA